MSAVLENKGDAGEIFCLPSLCSLVAGCYVVRGIVQTAAEYYYHETQSDLGRDQGVDHSSRLSDHKD